MAISRPKGNNYLATAAKLELCRTIVLVGLMGAGKTMIGRRVALRLNVPFFDSDHEIEIAAGMSVADIFTCHGEAAFRDAERKVIRRLLAGPVAVIATGGGAYMNEETRELIAEAAISVWLRASLSVLLARTARSARRPLLANGNPEQILSDLMTKRYPTYGEADIEIDSDNRSPEGTTEDVLQQLLLRGIARDAGTDGDADA